MAKTRSMTRNQNHDDDASLPFSKKRSKTFYNGDLASWSDVNHDVLFLVMMQLGVIDFLAFSGVCKSWRSLAIFNRNTFMASKPPMLIGIRAHSEDDLCHLKDFKGKKLKTMVPHFAGRKCVGSTCGYLILYGEKTRDFWLVNLITRHQLYFPAIPLSVGIISLNININGILVFSHSISGWVFVVLLESGLRSSKQKLSFSIAGKQGWNHVSSTLHIDSVCDLHVFKGKIYTLHEDCSLRELRLDLKRKSKWSLLETKIFQKPNFKCPKLVSSGENLYMTNVFSCTKKVRQLDFGEMKWVSPEKTHGEYVFFLSYSGCASAAIKPESWLDPRHNSSDYLLDASENGQHKFCYSNGMWWYFLHNCLNVNLLDE